MLLCGIDPGFQGAIAFLEPRSGELTIHDMPTAPNAAGKTELDLSELGQLLHPSRNGHTVAMLEYVAARPGQGAPATFRFGQSFGATQAFLVGHGWELHHCTPAKWKKHFGLTDKDLTGPQKKRQSLAHAKKLFPAYAHYFQRQKDDGRAEAALIVRYCQDTAVQIQRAKEAA